MPDMLRQKMNNYLVYARVLCGVYLERRIERTNHALPSVVYLLSKFPRSIQPGILGDLKVQWRSKKKQK